MTTYNFQAHDNKYNLATWDCETITQEDAIERFIQVLKDPSTANDEYEEKLHKAIIEKLGKKEYRVNEHPEDNEVYITIIFTEEEVNRLL